MNSHFIAILWSKGAPNWVICRRRMRRDQRWFIRTYSADRLRSGGPVAQRDVPWSGEFGLEQLMSEGAKDAAGIAEHIGVTDRDSTPGGSGVFDSFYEE